MGASESVNVSLMALHLVEDAINDPEGWSVRCGKVEVPAEIVVGESVVSVRAVFPPLSADIELSSAMSILKSGVERWVREVSGTSHAGFLVEWSWHIDTADRQDA